MAVAVAVGLVAASCAGGATTNGGAPSGWPEGSTSDDAVPGQDVAEAMSGGEGSVADSPVDGPGETTFGDDGGGDALQADDSDAQGDSAGAVCTSGSSMCTGQQPENCVGGQWQPAGSPCPYVCSGGACTGVCVPGSTQCSGNTPQTCDSMAAWQSGAACPYTCAAGTCVGACSPGSTESCAVCATTGTATCTSTSAWGPCAPPPGVCAFVDQSCSAQCDTVPSCWPHVDRSHNPTTGEHFYTTNDTEAACCGFTVEAQPYYYLYSTQQGGLTPFYRCLLSNGFHLYTTSSTCEGAAGATNEGSMGFIAASVTCGAVPLYRLSDATNGDHLYTISSAEVTSAESSGYTYEGIAGYVWTAPES